MFSESVKNTKLLVPYITGGLDGWAETVTAMEAAGADAVEVGIPFSDAVMDGQTICEANDIALKNGTTPATILEKLKRLDLKIPVIAMTYYNIAFRAGLVDFAERLKDSGMTGAILADMPYDSGDEWLEVCRQADISPVLLAAPTASDERLKKIAKLSSGFIYAVGLLGVTGERKELAASAAQIAARLKAITETPVLVGVGISTLKQAKKVCKTADGVVVGSVLVRTLMETGSPEAVASLVGEFKQAIG